MIYSLMHCMSLMLNGYLINNVGHEINLLPPPTTSGTNLPQFVSPNYQKIFPAYPCTDYQIAPIWDCRVALIGGISNTSAVRCPYTGILDMPSLTFVMKKVTLNHNRTHFATELVNEKMLFVCGVMNERENACEVWTDGKLQFEIANYIWDQSVGPRSNLTLHQLGDQLCAFGGTKLDGCSTHMVHCFNTSQPITKRNYATPQNYNLSSYRGGHSSIVRRLTNTSWKVFLCGGIGIRGDDQTCETFTVPSEPRSGSDYCSRCQRGRVIIEKHCKLIGTQGEAVGFLFGVDYNVPGINGHVADFYPTPARTPLPLKHNWQEIQLFNIDDHCPFSKELEDMLFSTTDTKSNATENPVTHSCPNPAQMGTNTLRAGGKLSTSAFVATIITLLVIITIMAIVIIGILTRRIPIMGTSAHTKCIEPNKKITEDSESLELRAIDSNRQDATDFPQNGITSVTSSGDLLELNSTESHLRSITCSKQRSNPRQHPVAFGDNLNNRRQSTSTAQQYTIDIESSAKC